MKSLIIYSLFLYLVGCSTEPEPSTWTVNISNTSSQSITITTFYEGEQTGDVILLENENGNSCTYSADLSAHRGYHPFFCETDSIKFEFDNGKGYLSSNNVVTQYDFGNDCSPFGNCYKYETDNDRDYFFVITQDDYENAHDLP